MDNKYGLEGELVVVTIPPGTQQILGEVESMSPAAMTISDALIIVPGKGFAKGQTDDMHIMFPQNTIVQQVPKDSGLAEEYKRTWIQIRSGIHLATAKPASKIHM